MDILKTALTPKRDVYMGILCRVVYTKISVGRRYQWSVRQATKHTGVLRMRTEHHIGNDVGK